MEYLINHNRFKKKFTEDKIEEYFNKKDKILINIKVLPKVVASLATPATSRTSLYIR